MELPEIDNETRWVFTAKGRSKKALNDVPWVDLNEDEFFEEISLLFILWVGHNRMDVATFPELTESMQDFLHSYLSYLVEGGLL